MQRRVISGHSPYEPVVGYARAVVAGDRVHVAGTAPIAADGSPPPSDPYEQAALCLRIVGDDNLPRLKVRFEIRQHLIQRLGEALDFVIGGQNNADLHDRLSRWRGDRCVSPRTSGHLAI